MCGECLECGLHPQRHWSLFDVGLGPDSVRSVRLRVNVRHPDILGPGTETVSSAS